MKTIKLACATLLLALPLQANDTISHTFFSIQLPFQGAMPEKVSLFYDRMNIKQEGIRGAFEIVPFGSTSVNPTSIGKYFLPFGKNSIVVGEFGSQAVQDNTVDVLANYFGVLTRPVSEVYGTGVLEVGNLTYQSLVRFKPVQSVIGIGLSYRQKISHFDCYEHGFWIQLTTPIVQVKNDLGYKEDIINPGGGTAGVEVSEGFVATLGDALRGQPVFGTKSFKYGKISNCPLKKWGLADIELAVGYEDLGCDEFYRMFYAQLIIPTGNKPNGEYIFEPIVGNNQHFGIALGGEYRHKIWCNQELNRVIKFHVTAHSQYLFGNTQRRSFDLMDKQWSRYIWMYDTQFPTVTPYDITPGINILTRKMHVYPRSQFSSNASFVYSDCNFSAEAGYTTYYRQAEFVDLACKFTEGPSIVGINETNTTQFATKSNATMRHYLDSQSIELDVNPANNMNRIVRILESDLDLRSAAQPALVAHAVSAIARYRWDEICYPTFVTLGISYEFAADNAGLDRWILWGKFGMSF